MSGKATNVETRPLTLRDLHRQQRLNVDHPIACEFAVRPIVAALVSRIPQQQATTALRYILDLIAVGDCVVLGTPLLNMRDSYHDENRTDSESSFLGSRGVAGIVASALR